MTSKDNKLMNCCDDDNMENRTLVEGVYKPTVAKKHGTQLVFSGDETSDKASWFLHWAALTADVPLFAAGIGMSWTSPVIPKFHGEENPFDHEVTTTQEAWIAALTPLGSAIGPLAAGYCADKLGRKMALLCLATPMVVGFFILAWATEIWLYYLARFLIGLGAGSAFAVVPMYVSEISQPHNRGKYGSLMGVLITLGILFPFSIGPPLSIAAYSVTCAVTLIIFLIIFAVFMPESPYYLITIKEQDKAHLALKKLRSRGSDIYTELKEMKEGVEAEKKRTADLMSLFTTPGGRKAFNIALWLVILQSLSGINPLISFLEPIYAAAGSTIPPNIATIITGFLIGLGSGSAFAIVPMYVSEISQAHNRGKYGSLMGVLITLGILYPFSIGPHLSITVYSVTCTVPLLIFLIIFAVVMPESPYYLIENGEYEKADSALRKLRRRRANIRKELEDIKEGVLQGKQNTAGVTDLFTSQAGRKALYISLGLVALQQFAGINPLLSFLKPIYSAAGSTIPPNTATIITGSVQVISNTTCVFIVEKMGKRLLLLICCVFSSISMSVLGIYFHLKLNGYNVEPIFWLPISCMIVYMIVFSFGLGPLPWAIMGEILPSNVKGIGSALTSTTSFLTASLVTFLFPIVSELLGMAGSFWLFAFFCLIGYFFVHFVLFETKGKSLAEIQRILQKSDR